MSTTCYFRANTSDDGTVVPGIHRGTNTAKLNGSTAGWNPSMLHTTRGTGATATVAFASTVTGATNGVEVRNTGVEAEWISLPLSAAVTISGIITLNLWAFENNMSANVAINAIIERLDTTGAVISTVAQTARITETGTAAAAENFTVTPTSTNMLKGERFRVRVYGDDAGTMATGFTFSFDYAKASAATDGDSFITFNETFTFQTSDPAGTTLYLTDVAGPAVGANLEKELWTSRGAGVDSIVVNTAAGWTAPIQWTDSGGGTAVEWYSRQLTAFTLADVVKLNLRANESTAAANASIRAELATCDSDGTNVTVWAAATLIDAASLGGGLGAGTDVFGELTTSEAAVRGYLAGSDLTVADGQRLRLRIFIDDSATAAMAASLTCTLYYDGTSGGASGDSFVILGQSVTEYVAASASTAHIYLGTTIAAKRAANW